MHIFIISYIYIYMCIYIYLLYHTYHIYIYTYIYIYTPIAIVDIQHYTCTQCFTHACTWLYMIVLRFQHTFPSAVWSRWYVNWFSLERRRETCSLYVVSSYKVGPPKESAVDLQHGEIYRFCQMQSYTPSFVTAASPKKILMLSPLTSKWPMSWMATWRPPSQPLVKSFGDFWTLI